MGTTALIFQGWLRRSSWVRLVGNEGLCRGSEMALVFQLSIEQAQTVAEQVEMKAKVVQSEVKAVTARHKKALEERGA